MTYQELVNACKSAYERKNMRDAYEYWKQLHNLLEEKQNAYDTTDDENRFKCFSEFEDYMRQFTDEEVYKITDYGREQEYRKYEIERAYSYLDKSVKCADLFKSNKKMKYLDDFISFYEWCILESEDVKGLYNIYDLQTNEIIDEDENNGNKTKVETILRLVDKSLSYELDEHCEDLDDEEYEKYVNSRYIKGLKSIQNEFTQRRIKELNKELKYEEKKIEICSYGKSDLQYIEHLKYQINRLGDR